MCPPPPGLYRVKSLIGVKDMFRNKLLSKFEEEKKKKKEIKLRAHFAFVFIADEYNFFSLNQFELNSIDLT